MIRNISKRVSVVSGIYIITNNKSNKHYIGSSKDISYRWKLHQLALDRGNHHNIHLQRSWTKHGGDAFAFKIIEECHVNALFEREHFHIRSFKGILYNIGNIGGGDNLTNHPNKHDIVSRITRSLRIQRLSMTSEERKQTWSMPGESNPNFGKNWDDAQRSQCSKMSKQRYVDNPALRTNASIRMKSFFENMSSEDYDSFCNMRSRITQGNLNPFYGKNHTLETKQKLSKLSKQRCERMSEDDYKNHPQTRSVSCDGTIYHWVSLASRKLGVTAGTIVHRCKSKNYPNFFYIS